MLTAPPLDLVVPSRPRLVGFRGRPEQVRAVLVGDDPDELVTIPAVLGRRILYDDLPLPPRPAPALRREVVTRLVAVDRALPDGFALTVLDGWRSPEVQQALLAHYRDQTPDLGPEYVADPADPRLVAPHTTGGAVDLTLSWRGAPLALGTDFDAFEPTAHLDAFEAAGADRLVRDLRRLLAHEMRAAGFAPYPWEWWHWSYGDQWWAADRGRDRSLFAAVDGPPAG